MKSTVVGNFPKVGDSYEEQKLRRAIETHQQGKISAEALEEIQNEVIREVIEIQISAGIQLITDGQIRWLDTLTWPARKLKGIQLNGLLRFFDNNVYYRQPVVESAVGWQEPIGVSEFQFAKKIAQQRADVKVVLPGPYTLARLSQNNHYGKFSDLAMDLARALSQEAQALEKAGATFIQFDEPGLPLHPEDLPMAFKAFELCVKPLGNIQVALYTYFSDISKIFNDLCAFPNQILGIDCAAAPENVELLKKVASPKSLALGIVDARNTKMEKEEALRALLNSVSKNASKIQFLNPSCGLEFLPKDIAIQKLTLIGNLVNANAIA